MQLFLTVADDIRQLADGKMAAMGLYGDRTIVITTASDAVAKMPEVPLGLRLALLISIRDLECGHHSIEYSLKAPDGSVQPLGDTFKHEVTEDTVGVNLLITAEQFRVPAAGIYVVRCRVDEQVTFQSEFEIRVRASGGQGD
jgi:hypothetical protein